MASDFRELRVWEDAMGLAEYVYGLQCLSWGRKIRIDGADSTRSCFDSVVYCRR